MLGAVKVANRGLSGRYAVRKNTMNRRELFRKTAAVAGAGALGTALGFREANAETTPQPAETMAKVPRKQLGTTGIEIPILLMGGSQKFDPTYDRTLHRGFAAGVDYLDTAQQYANGQSHTTLAPFIKQVGRENLWITSKVFRNGNSTTPEAYRSNLEKMLPDLQVDALDMFFMHGVMNLRQLDSEFIKMGESIKARGLTKHFGFSCHMGNVVELMNKAAKIGAPGIDAIMFRYSFSKYGDLKLNKAMDACRDAGIGLIAMKTQSSVPEDREEVGRFQSENFTLGQAKLKAVWADDRIDAAVSEMTNTQLVAENTAAAMSTEPLAMREFQQLNQYASRTAASRCQGCHEICESRVDGHTRIADTLRYLMYHECYGNIEEAKRLYRSLAPAEQNLAHDFADAAKACPQGIDIARRLEDAARVLA